jgi:hypothetical protein
MVREQSREPAFSLGRQSAPEFRRARGFLLEWKTQMQDVTMLFFTAIFFAVAFLYVKACQKLR